MELDINVLFLHNSIIVEFLWNTTVALPIIINNNMKNNLPMFNFISWLQLKNRLTDEVE